METLNTRVSKIVENDVEIRNNGKVLHSPDGHLVLFNTFFRPAFMNRVFVALCIWLTEPVPEKIPGVVSAEKKIVHSEVDVKKTSKGIKRSRSDGIFLFCGLFSVLIGVVTLWKNNSPLIVAVELINHLTSFNLRLVP